VTVACASTGAPTTGTGELATIVLTPLAGCSPLHLFTLGAPDGGTTITGSYTVDAVSTGPQLNVYADNSASSAGEAGCTQDSDGDGYADSVDPNPFVYCAIMRADVDGDGGVSILDLTKVAQWFTQTIPPAPYRYNQDSDTAISILDLTKIAQVFTQNVAACP
jgi:hypothetical protein